MSYYWFNRQELLKKAKEKYDNGGKEKAAKYYQDNKVVIKEKANDKKYKNLSEEKKEAKTQCSKDRYNKMKEKSDEVIKTSYYWFNREKLLKNTWDKYHNKEGKQKPANQEVFRENARNKYRNLSEKENNKKRKYQGER